MKNISIIVPVYNAEDTIERMLASFISNKDYIKEVILVNDRSTDNTFEKIEIFKSFFDIKVIDNQGNKGPGPGRKTGILAAEGEWITFVDADDCLTPNSLNYVSKQLKEYSELVLLHCQTLYYETGFFNPEHIHHSDDSCGGNFYKREYLIENKLFPHDSLFMNEDVYFNELINFYTKYIKQNLDIIQHYDYPVYEVHHDYEERGSFAGSNWSYYFYISHLLYKRYLIEFFDSYTGIDRQLKRELLGNIIFAYYAIEISLEDNENPFEMNILEEFIRSIVFFEERFKTTRREIFAFYKTNPNIKYIRKSVEDSVQKPFEDKLDFRKFLYNLENIKSKEDLDNYKKF